MIQTSYCVVIRVRVQDIPSNKNSRVRCLGKEFCQQVMGREMNLDLESACHGAEHYLPNFDSDNDVRSWFIYDFNVKGTLSRQDLLDVPDMVYLASRVNDTWHVTPNADAGQ